MKKLRTGLVTEAIEIATAKGVDHTVKSRVVEQKSCTITTVVIDNDIDAEKLEREKGKYITVQMDKVYEITDDDFESIVDSIAKIIGEFCNVKHSGRILIAGIGNREITADSLGPKTIDRIMVTRGLEKTMPHLICDSAFSSVSAISANVFGVTGIESAELIDGISRVLKPSLIIAIDALATTSIERLCKTIQISNTSLTPGGGVDNTRKEISSQQLNVPMISIGMPTVIDVKTILSNAKLSEIQIADILSDYANSLLAIPPRIDLATDIAAKLIAFSLNKAFHYNMSTEDILKFLY